MAFELSTVAYILLLYTSSVSRSLLVTRHITQS
nr:MAG TPA: hypothetical protein [Caudoviricetes sp.]